ncbi:MAG: hypothetical protein GQ565_11735 [Candidatus Aegiribacteria sp.]|nr:hypothetical protein [Candidatus Aegiribacteria sp.]
MTITGYPDSCKCRAFCPSCSKRKSLDLAIFLEEELFRSVPHRHWVWSVPKMLRLHFLHHRKLLLTPAGTGKVIASPCLKWTPQISRGLKNSSPVLSSRTVAHTAPPSTYQVMVSVFPSQPNTIWLTISLPYPYRASRKDIHLYC